MPELPEVERVRRTLEPVLVGASVTDVRAHRRDAIRRAGGAGPDPAPDHAGSAEPICCSGARSTASFATASSSRSSAPADRPCARISG